MSISPDRSPSPTPAAVTGVDWTSLGVPRRDPFTLRLTVGEAHLSHIVPHVPNTMFVQWLESMASTHSHHLGYTDQWHIERDLIWFIRRHEVDFLAEVVLGDELVMATWVEAFHKTSSPRRYVMYRPSDGRVVCRAMTIWVLVSRSRSKPQRIDPAMAAVYLA